MHLPSIIAVGIVASACLVSAFALPPSGDDKPAHPSRLGMLPVPPSIASILSARRGEEATSKAISLPHSF